GKDVVHPGEVIGVSRILHEEAYVDLAEGHSAAQIDEVVVSGRNTNLLKLAVVLADVRVIRAYEAVSPGEHEALFERRLDVVVGRSGQVGSLIAQAFGRLSEL